MNCPTRSRRHALQRMTAGLALPLTTFAAEQSPEPLLEVWKSPSCGCCQDWVAHLQANGFRTQVHETDDPPVRAKLGMPVAYRGCHAARVDGYTIEGHVPAADIRRLLKERPNAVGLAIPGMPIGSPGMDGPAYGGRRDPYDVLLVAKDGSARVYQPHRQDRRSD